MTALLLSLALQLAFVADPPAAPPTPPTPATPTPAPTPAPTKDGWQDPVKVSGTIDGVGATHDLIMYLPTGYVATKDTQKRPLVIALHGWNHSAAMYRDKGDMGRWADQHGVVLAVPDMGKTIYETALYKETKPKKAWSTVPGARWVGEVILPHVRAHYAVHGDRAHTGVMGYSTGGRGAVLLAELYPEFAFAGSVSGTFDLMRLEPKEGEYKIHAVVYGPRDKFEARWVKDNIIAPELLPKLAGVSLYVAHGDKDGEVKPDQLDALRDALKGADVKATWLLDKGAAHDWAFWNAHWGPMLAMASEAFAAPAKAP